MAPLTRMRSEKGDISGDLIVEYVDYPFHDQSRETMEA
jgi:hypothetical protein